MRPEHPLSSRDSVSVQELRPYSFLMVSPKDTPMYEQLVVQMCSKAGFSPLVSKYVSSPNAFICNFDTGMEIFVADTYMRDSENQQLIRFPFRIWIVPWGLSTGNPTRILWFPISAGRLWKRGKLLIIFHSFSNN